jgi:hypothetical protein
MIPVGLPWLILRWVGDDNCVRVVCLGCDWCASLLPGRSAGDPEAIDALFARFRADHAGCNPFDRPLRLDRLAAESAPARYNDPGE